MHGLALMLREGGWGAYLALFMGILGFTVAATALVTLAFSRRAAAWVGVAAIVLALLAPAVGLLGMRSGRHKTEEAVSMIESSVMAERILKMGWLEAQNAAKIGFAAAIGPLVLGLVAALVGGARKHRVVAGAVAAAAIVPTAGAFVASRQPPPKGKFDFDLLDDSAWNLAAARERAETSPALGCDELDKALREVKGDPARIVPDWRDTAAKCSLHIFDEIKHHRSTWTAKKLQDSPLLVDEAFRLELSEYTLSHGAGTGSGGFGYGHGRLGGPPRTPQARLRTGLTTVSGDLAAEAIQRVVHARWQDMRACYEKGLARNTGLSGRVATKFVIAPDGTVSSVSDAGSDLEDASVAECIRGVFKTLVFPAPSGTVTVTYPVVLNPAD